MSTENITNKLDNNKDKKISEEELKNNIAKFDANDWIVLTNELEKKNAELIKLLESPVSKVIKEKKLYNKYNKSVDELKILKLGFLCYNRGSQARTGTGIDNYCLQYGNNWETYKKNELPKMGILRTGKVDEEWLRMERIDNIKQASDAAVRAGTKVEPVVKPAPTRKPIPVANPTPADAVRESIYVHELPDVGIVKVDEKENIKEGSIKEILDNITTWAHDTYFSEYETCKLEANKRYMKEEEKDKQAYVTYELYLFSFSKYCESINGKHNDIISQAGYESMDEFESQMELMKEFQDSIALSLKYDKIGDEMKKFEQYVKEMESNKDKYFKGKSEEDIQNAEEKYTEFQSFQEKKYKEHGITEEILSSMNKIPESSGENQTYWENTGKILLCQIEINQWRQENGGKPDKNGDIIDKYDGYVKGGLKIRDKYSNLDFDLLNDYNNFIESWTSKGLDFKKYGEYASLMQKEGLNSHLKNISLIQSVLMDETNKEFPISQIRNEAIKKKEKQEKVQRIRDRIRYSNDTETAYYVFTSPARMWNTFIDITIGAGTSLGAMYYGIRRGKDEYAYQLKRKEKWDNFLKIGLTSSQTAPVYDPQTKSFNFHLDNTIGAVSSGIVNMLCLRYGGTFIGGGIEKLGASVGINMTQKVISGAGMFSMAFITQMGSSYQEAINGGLEGAGAFAYSIFSTAIQSGLELVSPNDVLVGRGMGLGKELVQNICGNGNKEGIKLIGKYFLKTVGREIAEENLQEGLQLAAGNLINDAVNGIRNTGLESDWSPKNFLSTAIITTLTTGITTGSTAVTQGARIYNSDQQQLIGRVSGDQELYENVMNVLDNSINGNFKIPNVDIESLKELRIALNNRNTKQSTNSDGTQGQLESGEVREDNVNDKDEAEIDSQNTNDTESKLVNEEAVNEGTNNTTDIEIDGEGISDNLLGEGDYQGDLPRIDENIEGYNTNIENDGIISKKGIIEIERFGKYFGINEQCIALQEMKKIVPNNVPNITNIEKDGDGHITSYEIEKIEGTTLSQYDRTKLNIDDLRNLLNIFYRFKENGIFHGDISMENILISEEMQDNGTIKKNFWIIDPIGYINIKNTDNIQTLSNEQFKMLDKIAQTKRGIKLKQPETGGQKRKNHTEKINNNMKKFGKDILQFYNNIDYSQYDLKTEAEICKKTIYISENYNDIKEVLTSIESNFVNNPDNIYGPINEYYKILKRAINEYDSTRARILFEINNIEKGDIIMIKEGNDYKKYKVKDIEQGNIILEGKFNNKIENHILSESDIDNIIGLKKNIKISEMREETELSGDVVEYLWPNGLDSEISQGISDCYFLVSLHNMKKQPGFKELMRSMVVPTKSGYRISFKESYNGLTGQSTGPQEIFLTHSEIYKRKNSLYSLRSDSIGDVILERAYMEFRNRIWCPDSGNIWDGKRKDNQKKLIDSSNLTYEIKEVQKKKIDKRKFAGEYGNPEEVFINFFGHGVKIEFLKATSLGNFNDDSFYASGQKGAGGDSAFFEANDINGNKIIINKNHAYILLDYNEENGTVTLANPHDTKFKRFTVTLSDYEKYFSGMYNIEWIDENETTLNEIVADMINENSFHFDKIKGVEKTELIFESLYNQFGKMIMNKKILEDHINNILASKTSTEKINKYNNFINDFGEYSNDVKEFLEGAGIKEYLGMNPSLTSDVRVTPENNPEYFNGKSHKFNVTEGEARYYSKRMDGYLSQIQENGDNLPAILAQLREDINAEYKMVTGTDQNLDLTDEQLISVLDAHEQDGVLGELTIGQLRQKVKTLAETITDPNLRRFLLEAGFCGSQENIEILNNGKTNVEQLEEIGIKISEENKGKFNKMNLDFEKLKKLKDLKANIDETNIELFLELELTDKNIKFIKENYLTDYYEIKFAITVEKNRDLGIQREYLQRKQEYLKKHRTISEEKFLELFGKEGKDKKRKKGKYGKYEIKQDNGLGLCYMYSGFETFKKTNGFNEIIQTHLKETSEGWEVKLPFLSNEGKWIKVNKNEIDKLYTDKYGKSININSDTSLGFKILEIAYIKKSILSNSRSDNTRYKQLIEQARNEYNETGDLNININLLNSLELGHMTEFYELILGENCISPTYTDRFEFYDPHRIFNEFNSGLLKVELIVIRCDKTYRDFIVTNKVKIISTSENPVQTFNIPDNWDGNLDSTEIDINKGAIEVISQSGEKGIVLAEQHAYSIEKCYIDGKTKEKRVQFINPRNTEIKYDMAFEDCEDIFGWQPTGINIDIMFREDIGGNGINQAIGQSNESENYLQSRQETQGDITPVTNNILNELGIENLNLESITHCLETANRGQLTDLFKLKEAKQIVINELSKSDFLDLLKKDFDGDLMLTLLDREGCEILSKCKNISERVNYLLTRSRAKETLLKTDYFCDVILNNSNHIRNLNQYISDNQYFFDYVTNNIGNNYRIILEFNEKEQIQLLQNLDIPIDFIKNNLTKFKKESIEWLLNNKIESIEDDISREDFEYLVDNHTEFPKSIITPKLINRLLETRDMFQSRILIEKFSIDNDARLFNKILGEREEKIIETINHENGLLLKYNQLLAEFEKLEYNKNNIYEFWEAFEKYNIEIDHNFRESFIEAFPNKSKIQNLIREQSIIELSDIIIDYHFNDISYNVFLDIKQLLNFQISNGVSIPVEHLKIYRDILNIDNLSVEEKIDLHNSLKEKNIVEMFYNDYSSSRDIMYQEISDSILNNNTIKEFEDKGLTEQYGVNVYKFDGQDFIGLVRRSPYTNEKSDTVGCSFSLIGTNCIGIIGGKPHSETFVYEGLEPQAIIHAYPSDSYTQLSYSIGSDAVSSHYVRTLMTPTELLNATQDYNEVLILRKGRDDSDGYGNIGEIRPIALYCYDEITPEDIEVAKRESVGIMLINTSSYQGVKTNGHWYQRDENLRYVKGEDDIENARGNREVRTSFEKTGELNDIIEGYNKN